MKIQLLKDNTVTASYEDGTNENVNSGHSHKALSPETKALAEAFVYGEENIAELHSEMSFNGTVVRAGQVAVTPLDVLPITPTNSRLLRFCAIVFAGEDVKHNYVISLPIVNVVETKSIHNKVDVVKKDAQGNPVMEDVSINVNDYEVTDGKAVAVISTATITQPSIERFFEYDAEGNAVMIDVPVLDSDGEPVTYEMIRYKDALYTYEEMMEL